MIDKSKRDASIPIILIKKPVLPHLRVLDLKNPPVILVTGDLRIRMQPAYIDSRNGIPTRTKAFLRTLRTADDKRILDFESSALPALRIWLS